MQRRIEAVRRAVAPFPRRRVLYVLWPDPLIVPGRESMLTELIEVAGGTSITAADGEAYPRFSLEAAVARAPEVIILADHSTGASTAGRSAPEKWKRLTSVPAIQAGRLHSADLAILHRYGPRVPEGLETARALHPSRGVPVSPAATARRSSLGVAGRHSARRHRARALRGQRAALAAGGGAGAGRPRRRRVGGVDRHAAACACRASSRPSWPGARWRWPGVGVPGADPQSAGRAGRAGRVERRGLRRGAGPDLRPRAVALARRSALAAFAFAGALMAAAAVYLIAVGPRRAVDPDAAAGRRDRRHLLHLGDHRADLRHGLQPPGRRHPLAARQPGARFRPASLALFAVLALGGCWLILAVTRAS